MRWRTGAGMLAWALAGSCWAAAPEPARAGLTCEQVLAVSQTAVRYRDEGYSLSQVLGALKGIEIENKLSRAELDLLQKAVSASYLSQASPEEITLECVKSGALGKPASAGSQR